MRKAQQQQGAGRQSQAAAGGPNVADGEVVDAETGES